MTFLIPLIAAVASTAISTPLPVEHAHVFELLTALFLLSLTAIGIIVRLYVGRVVSKLDQVEDRLTQLEHARTKRWEEHIAVSGLRDIDIEKRLSRIEMIAETFHKINLSKVNNGLRKLED